MNKTKIKKLKKIKMQKTNPDHFTVFNLREGWEEVAPKYNSQETIESFKKRQEILKTIPESIRIRTKKINHIVKVGLIQQDGFKNK